MTITFVPSNVHQGHYIHINGENTGEVVNYFAYLTIRDYQKKVNEKIESLKQQHKNENNTN